MSISNRLSKLEQGPQPKRPHGMTNAQLAKHFGGMDTRQQKAFIQTMTDGDLNDSIDYLKEQQHGNT